MPSGSTLTGHDTSTGKLPDGWIESQLGELVTTRYGKSLDKTRRYEIGPIPVVGSAGLMAWTEESLADGDVIVVGRKGNVGAVQLFEDGVWPIDTVYFFESPQALNPHFFLNLLRSKEMWRLDSSTSTPSLRREDMEAVVVQIPPLGEQERIVEVLEAQLSRLDAALKHVQTLREKADQFRRSLLHAAFTGALTGHDMSNDELPEGWKAHSLGEIEQLGWVKLGRGKVISKRDIESKPGAYPIYSSASKNGGEFGRYGEYSFDEELITWSVDGGGHLFHRPKHRFSVTNVGGWIRVLNSDAFSYKYLFFALTYAHSQTVFDWSRKAHPSVIRLVYDAVPIAPRREQERIVEGLESQFSRLDAVLAVADEVEERASALRRSLLYAAFAGKLTEKWREENRV